MTFQKARKPQAGFSLTSSILPRGVPFEQAQLRAACLRYSFRNGFVPRDGRVPLARKMSKPKQD